MTAHGALRFARYAYPPNALGYCGPDDALALREYTLAGMADRGLVALARQFAGAWPYLTLIAAANGRGDPLDAAVVEAYWLGNRMLERVPASLFASHLANRFSLRADGSGELAALAFSGGRAHHNFHVFCVYPWAGMLRAGRTVEPMRVLESCRVRAGRVVAVHDGHAAVRLRPLTWTGRELRLGPASVQPATLGVAAEVGDIVAVHWNWACETLDPARAAALHRYTLSQLHVANHTLARPVADRVL